MDGRRLDERQLEQLLAVGRSLVSELDIEAVLEEVLRVARELTGARYAALGILDERKHELERFLVVGLDERTRRAIGELPRGRGLLGELIRRPEPLRLANVGKHPRSYGFPPGHPPMTSFLGVPIKIRGESWGNLYLTDKDAGRAEFGPADEELVVTLADWAAIAIDNARLYASLDRRHSELERVARGLEANAAIASAVGGETDVDRVPELIAKRARALLAARTVLVMQPEDDELLIAAAAGEDAVRLAGQSIARAGSIPGDVLETGRAERLPDLSSRMRSGLAGLALDATGALIAPLIFRGRPQGVLAAFDREEGGEFDVDDELILGAFAATAATAIATAQTVESEKLHLSIEASEQERRRWARELHDETLQELASLKLTLETAIRVEDEAVRRRSLSHAVAGVDRAVENLRGLITDLRPAALDELGVWAALDALVHRIDQTSDLQVDYRADLAASARLAPEIESALYRLVQEGLNNVVKHARANRVELRIDEDDRVIRVEIRDDGVGFDSGRTDSGWGLVGMRERMALVDGALRIDSVPGEGTTLTARVPALHVAPDRWSARRAGGL